MQIRMGDGGTVDFGLEHGAIHNALILQILVHIPYRPTHRCRPGPPFRVVATRGAGPSGAAKFSIPAVRHVTA
ncbi:hypothetical protein GCM10027562_18720 [Arthrobacter pigmenti]